MATDQELLDACGESVHFPSCWINEASLAQPGVVLRLVHRGESTNHFSAAIDLSQVQC